MKTLLAVLVTLAAAVLWLRPGAGTIDSLAVLPFVNVGGDPNAEYLSDGITESLINSVSQIPGIKVVAPAFPADVKGLLAAAIRDDNPVLFFTFASQTCSERIDCAAGTGAAARTGATRAMYGRARKR